MIITVQVRTPRSRILGCKQTLPQLRDLVSSNSEEGSPSWRYLKFRVRAEGAGAKGLVWVNVKLLKMFEVQTLQGEPLFIAWGWVGNQKVLVNYSPDWVRFESTIEDSRWR